MAVLQMTWQTNLLNQKRKSGPPVGLKNLGNTCYLNSVLQCLTYTPPLANFCLKSQHSSSCDLAGYTTERKDCPFCILEKRIARSLKLDLSLDSPLKINSSLRIFAEHFRHGKQEDAHEFLRYVIDACHNTCLRLRKLQLQRRKGGKGGEVVIGETIVKDIFGGALQNQVKCLSCGMESNKVDEIMDISLDILHSSSLEDALEKFFQPETLDGNNKYQCDTCKKLVAARKQMSILQAPNVLVIQLKRFEGIFGGKVDKSIAFKEALVLSGYMCKGTQDPYPEYRLFGTIVHSGFSADSGHYYAYIKDAMGCWYCCNDSHVTLSTLQEVVSEKAYILFFTRSKQRPSPSKTAMLANGSKCSQSNGNKASKFPRPCQTERPENSSTSDNQAAMSNSKCSMDKVPSGPSKKLDIFDSGARKIIANGVIKFSIHKKEPFEKNHNPMKSGGADKDKEIRPIPTECNGVIKFTAADATDSAKCKTLTFANGNGRNQNAPHDSVDAGLNEGLITKDSTLIGRRPEHKELSNGNVKCNSESSGLKRKSEVKDPCVLLAKDTQSCFKVEEFKEVIEKEASQVLRSCGWSDDVFKFMHSQKKKCLSDASSPSDILEIKRSLIADAKPLFIPKIPESLKGSLVQRLMVFSQQKEATGTRAV